MWGRTMYTVICSLNLWWILSWWLWLHHDRFVVDHFVGNNDGYYALSPQEHQMPDHADISVSFDSPPKMNPTRSLSLQAPSGRSSRKTTRNGYKYNPSGSESTDNTYCMLLQNHCLRNGKPKPTYQCEPTSKHQFICKVYIAKTCGWIRGLPADTKLAAKELAAKELWKKIGFWTYASLNIVQCAQLKVFLFRCMNELLCTNISIWFKTRCRSVFAKSETTQKPLRLVALEENKCPHWKAGTKYLHKQLCSFRYDHTVT